MVWPPQGEHNYKFEMVRDIICPQPLECRSVSGTAAFCGYLQFYEGEEPANPTFYRASSWSGAISWIYRLHSDGSYLSTETFTVSGSSLYDGATCECAGSNQSEDTQDTDPPIDDVVFYGCAANAAALWDSSGITTVVAANSITQTADGGTYSNPGNPSVDMTVSGSLHYALTVPDTVADAVARMSALNTWSDWAPVSGESCRAYATGWTSSGSFSSQRAQWRVRWVGLTPNTDYNVSVQVKRRVVGTFDPFADYATQTEPGTTDSDGSLEVIADVPNDGGFDTIVVGPAVVEEA